MEKVFIFTKETEEGKSIVDVFKDFTEAKLQMKKMSRVAYLAFCKDTTEAPCFEKTATTFYVEDGCGKYVLLEVIEKEVK